MVTKRVIDPELEKEIKQLVDGELAKARQKMESAKASVDETKQQYEQAVADNPFQWVAGAFVAGLLMGKILSK